MFKLSDPLSTVLDASVTSRTSKSRRLEKGKKWRFLAEHHEALAIVHAIAGDESFARREIALALLAAPSHIRSDLEEERKVIDSGRLPPMNWNERLVKLWRSGK